MSYKFSDDYDEIIRYSLDFAKANPKVDKKKRCKQSRTNIRILFI